MWGLHLKQETVESAFSESEGSLEDTEGKIEEVSLVMTLHDDSVQCLMSFHSWLIRLQG